MKLGRGDKWMAAVTWLAAAAMALCFAAGQAGFHPLAALPPVERGEVVEPADGLVDINTAGLEELMTLPNIGEVRAQAILDYRARTGPFRYPEELIYVNGIGEGILAGLLDRITAGGG